MHTTEALRLLLENDDVDTAVELLEVRGPELLDAGFGATLLSVILALLPPEGSENPQMFVLKVGGGCLLFIAFGLMFYFLNRRTAEQPA